MARALSKYNDHCIDAMFVFWGDFLSFFFFFAKRRETIEKVVY